MASGSEHLFGGVCRVKQGLCRVCDHCLGLWGKVPGPLRGLGVNWACSNSPLWGNRAVFSHLPSEALSGGREGSALSHSQPSWVEHTCLKKKYVSKQVVKLTDKQHTSNLILPLMWHWCLIPRQACQSKSRTVLDDQRLLTSLFNWFPDLGVELLLVLPCSFRVGKSLKNSTDTTLSSEN